MKQQQEKPRPFGCGSLLNSRRIGLPGSFRKRSNLFRWNLVSLVVLGFIGSLGYFGRFLRVWQYQQQEKKEQRH